jgi:LysR family hydrogen peroxide-inducible transcriptional activator
MRDAPHAFTLRQLQYFRAVAEMLSFGKAAERCRVAQPSLSAQIAALEKALGVGLFERNRRKVLVTAAGRELLERARRVLVRADELADAALRLSDPLSGMVRVGVIPTISPYLLPSVTPALHAGYPRLTIVWVEEKTPVLAAQLASGELDAALLALEAEVGDFESAVVATDPFVLAAPKGNALVAPKRPARTEELRGQRVLLLDDGHCFRDQALAVCSRAKARELEVRATSLPTLSQMVARGLGVTLLPRLAVETEAARAGLAIRPFAEPAPRRTIALIWRRGSPWAATLKKLAATLAEAYPGSGPAFVTDLRNRTKRRKPDLTPTD